VTSRGLTAVLARILTVVVLATSGAYLLVYLYRWEWNRALVSGVFFVAAEVALGFSVVLRRLRAIEARMGEPAGPRATLEAEPASSMAEQRLAATPVERHDPFAWLSPGDGRLGVFVPVLLGAGVMLSALAYLVERLAQVTAVPGLDRRLSRRLDVLAPPAGGLTRTSTLPPSSRRRTRGSPVMVVLGLLSAGVLLVVAVGAIADATQTRPQTGPVPATTRIELVIDQRGAATTATVAAEALWATCRPILGAERPADARIVTGVGNRVDLVLRPGVTELARRRLVGCLTDLQLDLVQAYVIQPTP
jgi:hypothetical protein